MDSDVPPDMVEPPVAVTRQPDLVVAAGWVLTMGDPVDGVHPVIPDGAVAIADGRIVDVGPARSVVERAGPAPVRRLPGHVLLPGLVNAHTHLAMTMFRGFADDLDLSAFLERLLPVEAAVLTSDRVRLATRAAAVESVSAGTTTALDMYFFADAALTAADEVGLRLLTGPVFLDGMGPAQMDRGRVVEWAQGWLDRHPARPDWRPVIGPHSTYAVSPDLLRDLGELATDHGAVFHVHAAETATEVETVRTMHGARPVEVLESLGLLGPRTVIGHGVHLTDAEIEAVASAGASVAHCPASNMKLGSGLARIPELLGAGANVALGTDGPASSNDLDILGAARLAALLHKGLAIHGGTGDATNLPAAEVLRLATIGGARALGIDAAVGSIEVGKCADLVAIDLDRPHVQPVYDPASAVVYAAGRGDVTDVWVGGRAVVVDSEVMSIDPAVATADLRSLQRDVLSL